MYIDHVHSYPKEKQPTDTHFQYIRISMVSKGVMVLMVKLVDESSSDEMNFSANQSRASQFRKIPARFGK